MSEDVRHSKAEDALIVTDPQLVAELEIANGLKQFELVTQMVHTFVDPERPFRFRPSHIQSLHRAALEGLTGYAGLWRPSSVGIKHFATRSKLRKGYTTGRSKLPRTLVVKQS